jgi:hypothetical protein
MVTPHMAILTAVVIYPDAIRWVQTHLSARRVHRQAVSLPKPKRALMTSRPHVECCAASNAHGTSRVGRLLAQSNQVKSNKNFAGN